MNFEKQVRNRYQQITQALVEQKLTITTMESATAGQIASLITDTEGASAVMKGAFITYSNEAKILMGVPAEVIAEYTVYSPQTACAMAEQCALKMNADIGIGVTGTMGNKDPANPHNSIPGKVFFAIAQKGKGTDAFELNINAQPSRYNYKLAVADLVAKELEKILKIS